MAERDPYKYFRVEARELGTALGKGILEIEKSGATRALVAELLRHAHTLKGAARVVRVSQIAERAHAIEEILAPNRDHAGPLDREKIAALLSLVDQIEESIPAIDAPQPSQPSAPRALPEEPLETVRVDIEELDLLLEGVTEATVQAHALRRQLLTLARAQHLAGMLAEGMSASLRTSALAEELRNAIANVKRSAEIGIEQVTAELAEVREAANRLRLLPAKTIFPSLERAARDAAQSVKSNMSFHATGGDIRLDGHILTTLRDALLQVVRNAVAHGIESDAERFSAGKTAVGRVEVRVTRRGNRIVFTCADDGRGIDVDALKRAAVTRGLVEERAVASLAPEEVFSLLLRGGFTTARAVTEVSGRGIGLDLVRETMSRLKGDVSVVSERGHGTSIELAVPVSLTSLSAFVVDAGGALASIPVDGVRHAMRLTNAEIVRSEQGDSIVWGGKVIPFLPLSQALARSSPAGRGQQPWSAVIVDSGDSLAAIGVDRILGASTIVMRALPLEAQVSDVVLGASLDATGNPQIVLDPRALVSAAHLASGHRVAFSAVSRPPLLVIDDSLTTRMLEQSILESAGYEVDLAVSAEDGMVKAKSRRYGVFIVDVEMPGMNGFEFVETTRADPDLRTVPTILVTSRGSPEDRLRGKNAGARGYIVKGEFDQEHLLRTIRELLGS